MEENETEKANNKKSKTFDDEKTKRERRETKMSKYDIVIFDICFF